MSHIKHQDTSRISAATADRDGVLLSMEIGHPEDSSPCRKVGLFSMEIGLLWVESGFFSVG